MDISFPSAFYDKWENGEIGYWFSHSGTVVIQQVKELVICHMDFLY